VQVLIEKRRAFLEDGLFSRSRKLRGRIALPAACLARQFPLDMRHDIPASAWILMRPLEWLWLRVGNTPAWMEHAHWGHGRLFVDHHDTQRNAEHEHHFPRHQHARGF
jgi:hypothetical protein